MKRCTWSVLLFAGLWALACSNAKTPTTDEVRSGPPADSSISAPEPVLPYIGQGSFESLVADYESKDRAIWQKPDMVISMLGDLNASTVADVGAGTGYFAFRLVPKARKVIAIEIDQEMINFMDSIRVRLPQRYQTRFETRLATPESPLLKKSEADAAIIVNTYAYIDNRVQYMQRLAEGLSENGRILIIDFKKNNINVGPADEYKVAVGQVQHELKKAGYDIVKIDNESLDFQYIILAQKKLTR